MYASYAFLAKCGLWAVIFGYMFRYVWPMAALLFWQTLLGPIVRAMGAKLPEDSKAFFYAPKVGDPLVFHWFHPNHQIAMPVLFTVGVCFGVVIAKAGEQGYEAIAWLFSVIAFGFFVWRGALWIASKDGIAAGLERAFFTVSSILEICLLLTVVRQAANT